MGSSVNETQAGQAGFLIVTQVPLLLICAIIVTFFTLLCGTYILYLRYREYPRRHKDACGAIVTPETTNIDETINIEDQAVMKAMLQLSLERSANRLLSHQGSSGSPASMHSHNACHSSCHTNLSQSYDGITYLPTTSTKNKTLPFKNPKEDSDKKFNNMKSDGYNIAKARVVVNAGAARLQPQERTRSSSHYSNSGLSTTRCASSILKNPNPSNGPFKGKRLRFKDDKALGGTIVEEFHVIDDTLKVARDQSEEDDMVGNVPTAGEMESLYYQETKFIVPSDWQEPMSI